MALWQRLYAMVWLSFFTILIALFDIIPFHEYIHALPALAMIVLGFANKATIKNQPCPERIKRIVGATAGLCVGAAVTGILMAIPQLDFISRVFEFLHIMVLVAITTQTGSAATSYDMFGEGEFVLGDKTSPETPADA